MAGPYYVQSDGNDANGGTSWGAANAWKTIQKAAQIVTTGEIVYVAGDGGLHGTGTYPVDTVTMTNDGLYSAPVNWFAVDGEVTLDATGNNYALSIRKRWHLFDVVDPTTDSWLIANSNQYGIWYQINISAIYLRNVRVTNCTRDGVVVATANGFHGHIINCTFDNCSRSGWANFQTGQQLVFLNCAFHSNTWNGFNNAAPTEKDMFINCLFYNNTQDGLYCAEMPDMLNCVIADNGQDGVQLTASPSLFMAHVYNNIFYNNTGYGVNANAAEDASVIRLDYNCWFSNDGGGAGADVQNVTKGAHAQNTDPTFTDPTTPAWDYTLQDGSPCLDTGYPDGTDVNGFDANINKGAYQTAVTVTAVVGEIFRSGVIH